MCYRYAFENKKLNAVAAKLGIKRLPPLPQEGGNFNAAPTNFLPIVLNNSAEDTLSMELARFGLIPYWYKGNPKDLLTMNARAEMLKEKPSFQHLLNGNRCLIPATGFYEWKKVGKLREPYYIQMLEEAPFFFSGLFDDWFSMEAQTKIRSFTIITTSPNSILEDIHHRMPAIIPSFEAALDWTNPVNKFDSLDILLKPIPAAQMQKYKVRKTINEVNATNTPKLKEPLPPEAQAFTSSLFSN